MRQYETGFLIAPSLSDEESENLIKQMADIVGQKNGRMVKLEKWGKRKLAYAIKRFQEASFVFFTYEGGADIPQELGRRFRHMDTVLRHLTLVKTGQENVRNKKKARVAAARRAEARPAEEAEDRSGPKADQPVSGESHGQ